MPEESRFVVVYEGNTIEADLVKSLLEGNGITAFLKDEVMGTLAPFYVTPGGAGAVKVVVAREDLHLAEPILQEFLDGEPDPQ